MDPQRRDEQEEVTAERSARGAARLDELLAAFWDGGLWSAAIQHPSGTREHAVRAFLEREFGGCVLAPDPAA